MVSASSLSADERKAYNHLYNLADKEQLGVLTGDIAIVFFEKTQLPGHLLGEIWQLSDKEDTGFLTKEAFYTACRLIGHAQNGQTPSASLAEKLGPLPWFQGVTIPGLAQQPTKPSGSSSRAPGTPTRQASTPVAPASPSPAASRPAQRPTGGLSVSPDDKAKYTRLFYNAGPVAGLLDGDKASEILKKSRLPDEKLGQIWNLADTQSRGALDTGDFVIAMTLIQATMNGSLTSLPDELPDSIYTQAGASKAGMASSLPNLGAMQTPGSPLRAQYTGNRAAGAGAAPLYPQNTGNMQPPSRASTLGQSQNRNTGGAAWAITPLEKSQSDTFFAMLDTARSGSLSGDVAGPFFMQSGLSGDVLASIWDLSDIKNDGQLDREEFALARRLVMDTLAGKSVPERLEESFVPPSLRDQWRGSGQQQQVQQSEVQRDLFSLMDDDDASSLPAPVQQVGATAFNPQSAPTSQFQPASQQGSRIASPAPLQPMLTGGSARSATPVRSAPPPVPATRSALASPPTNASTRDFFDATPVEEEPPKLDERSAELGNLQNQVSQTQRSVSNLRSDRTKLTAEVNKIEEQINELKVSLSQAKAAYDTESTNMTNLEARHSKGSQELKNLKEETIRAESDLSGLKEQKAELEQSILKDKEEIREYTKKLKSTNEEVASLREQLEKLKKEARQQKGMVVVSKKQLSTAEGEEEKLQQDIQEEERAARAAPPPVPALPARPSESARAVPLPESRASPALSATSTRSNNPFDRMGSAAAGAALGAGLAVPAAAYAARSPSPLHDAFSVSAPQQQQASQHDDFDAFDKEEQDPFGMSTSAASLPPQQAAAPAGGFGFDDDFDNAFGAPASQQQPFASTAATQATTASRPNMDFDDAFADFDRGTSAPEGGAPIAIHQTTEDSPAPIAQPATGKDEPENAPVRAASPTTAERSLQANQPEPELPVQEERTASPTATAPFISAAPAGEAFGDSEEIRSTEGPIDSELQSGAIQGFAPAPYESRSVPDNDTYSEGGDDLAPIRDVEQPDSDSDSDTDEAPHQAAAVPSQDEQPQSELHSSSRATYLGDNAGDDIYEKPLDKGKGRAEEPLDKGKGRAEEPLPGAYPSDDEDTFEDAVPFSQENSMSSPQIPAAQFSSIEDTQHSAVTDSHERPESAAYDADERSAPKATGFDDAFDSSFQSAAPASQPTAFEAAPSSGMSAQQDAAVVTHQEAPSAGFAETGMTVAKEAEHTKRPDDFDDFEDLSSVSRGPSGSEPAPAAAAPISARSGGSFEDNFDDDFGFDKQTFSHTITSQGVGKATDPGTEAAQQNAPTNTSTVPSGFDDAFEDAFAIPQHPGQPQMRVVGSPVAVQSSAPSGFDDDFFTSSSSAPASQPSNNNAFASQAPSTAATTSAPALPARDDSYIYAPPPGSPPISQQQPIPEQRPETPVSHPQANLQAPAPPQRRESDGDLPQVKELRDMGFERSQSIAALEDNQYDVGRAANALLAVNQ